MSAPWYRRVRLFAGAVAVLLGGALLLSAPASATPSTGSISGTVTIPVGTTSGYLYLLDTSENYVWSASAVTGSYSFTNLNPGTYFLYLEHFNGPALGERYVGGTGDFAGATPITVNAGANTVFNVTVATGPAITGHVYAADGSTPVSGVGVALYDQGHYWSSGYGSWSTTDASGYFAIGTTGLPSNQYTLRYDVGNGTGWTEGDVWTYFWGGAYTVATATFFPIADGVSGTGYDLQLLASGGSISGHVTGSADPTGLGVVSVSVMRADDPSSDLFGAWNPTTTDASGNYSVAGLPPGDYVVSMTHRVSNSSYAPQVYSGASQLVDADVVTVGVGTSATGVNVQLIPGATVSGRIVDESNPSAGVGSVSVYLVSADGLFFPPSTGRAFDPLAWGLSARGQTDVDGYYTVDVAVPPGNYRVWFVPPSADFASAFWGGGISLTGADVLTVAGTAPVTANAALVPAGSISGEATRDGIAPTEPGYGGAFAIAYAYDDTADSWLAIAEAEFLNDGTYSIPGLAQGTYKVGFYDRNSNAGYHPSPWVYGTPTVFFDNEADLASATTVTVTGTANTPGIDVVFRTGGGVIIPAPVVSAVSPSSGSTAGGTTVTVTGTDLTGATSVTFGGLAGTSLSVSSDTALTVTTPAHAAGPVSVVVTTPGGASLAASFTYVAGPAITNVSPLSGPVAGGTVVTLTGTAFTGATSVTFGGVAGTALSVASATSLTVTSPAHAVGPVNVVVTTSAGSSAPATFTYRAIPVVASVSPGFGPTTGGTTVTVTGSGFTDASQVTFGGVAGTGLSVGSDTSLTVTSPAGSLVRAPIVVTNPVGGSAPAAAAFFAYTDGAVVAGIPEVIADVAGFTPNVVRCYQVTGKAGVPVGAVGVVLNVTASLPNAPGHVRVYPDYLNNGASPAPAVSTVNFEVARDVANSTTISLPTGGKVCAYGVGGTLARLILDVDGYILPGSGITLVTPEKLVDTRPQAWYHAGTINGPVQPMTDYEVQVGGVGSVPSDAVAVIANITVVDTRSPGHLRMWASDQTMPNTSVVNYAPETKANSQIVALSADGKLTFRSFSYVPTSVSPVQVLIDVTGYIAAGSDFVATVPTKLIETRPAYGIVGPISGPLSPGVIYPVPVDTSVVPAGATAVILNVTAVQPTAFGHIRVYPDTNGLGTTPPPVMSNLNFIPGRDIPNMVIVQLPPDRKIDLYTVFSGGGRTDLVVNIIGYIAAPTA